ncbi:unnamed protein product [Arabidopsis thaliana]|nr:unnamed protein product [Arabidopsis thaliana]
MEEVVREIDEHVEQFLVCDDVAMVSYVGLNSRSKEGVVVHDVRREILCAKEEVGREIDEHVEQFLVCDDATVVSYVALNPGSKEDVVVNDVRREIISSLVLENPGVVLEDV